MLITGYGPDGPFALNVVSCRECGATVSDLDTTTHSAWHDRIARLVADKPAGAPLYSEDRCETCGHITDCCGNCKCEGTQHE